MNLQGQLIVSLLILSVIAWIIYSFRLRRLNSTQTLFWLILLIAAEIMVLSPKLVDRVLLLWGNLVPGSWISFLGLIVLIVYLLYQSTQINRLEARSVQLVRRLALLEKRLRDEEARRP